MLSLGQLKLQSGVMSYSSTSLENYNSLMSSRKRHLAKALATLLKPAPTGNPRGVNFKTLPTTANLLPTRLLHVLHSRSRVQEFKRAPPAV
jgi:hypothetical protein